MSTSNSSTSAGDSVAESHDRVAVITGGGSGVGAASAAALAAAGWTVVVAGRRQTNLEATVNTVTDLGGTASFVIADVGKVDDCDHLFAAVEDRHGRVDLLFNNAGSGARPVPLETLTYDEWRTVVDVNLTGSFLCAQRAIGLMKRQDPSGGRIINNGSISATTPRPFSAPYTATKHAITGLTKSIDLDGRPFGISCGQIDIGNAASPLTERMTQGILQPDGSTRVEPVMEVKHAANAVVHMASLPPEANILTLTVMASTMPFVGRG